MELQQAIPPRELEKDARQCYNEVARAGMRSFKQCDPRWKCSPYNGHQNLSSCNTTSCTENNICVSGCGITSTASVLTYYFPKKHITPVNVANYLVSAHFRDDRSNVTGATCNGVSHTAICAAGAHWGLPVCNVTKSFNELDAWLKDGPVIAHVRHKWWKSEDSCKFTRAGHYIVIINKRANNTIYNINDPNSCATNRTYGTQHELSADCELVGFIRIG